MFAPVLVTPPAALLTFEEADRQLRLDGDVSEKTCVESLIAAATGYLDGWSGILGRALVTQTWRQDYSGFCDRMSLPLGPVASISTVKYFDADDVEQTFAGASYRLLTDALGSYVARVPSASWPAVGSRDAPVSITFVAGTAADAVPMPIKQAILLLVAHWFENREAVGPNTIAELPLAVNALIAPYRRVGF